MKKIHTISGRVSIIDNTSIVVAHLGGPSMLLCDEALVNYLALKGSRAVQTLEVEISDKQTRFGVVKVGTVLAVIE
jgi:hypothetical protein